MFHIKSFHFFLFLHLHAMEYSHKLIEIKYGETFQFQTKTIIFTTLKKQIIMK